MPADELPAQLFTALKAMGDSHPAQLLNLTAHQTRLVLCHCHSLLHLALPQVFDSLLLEEAVPPSQHTYCPYKDCGLMLQRPDEDEQDPDEPVDCPHCDRPFCLECGIAGWHEVSTGGSLQGL